MVKKLFSIIGIFLFILSLVSCSKSTNIELIEQKLSNSNNIVFGANESGSISCLDGNMLYIKNKVMKIYDIEKEKSFPLCSKPNCTHTTINCSACIDNKTFVSGLAYYSGKVYAFFDNIEKNTIEFIQMNIDGTDKKVIHTIDKGNAKPNSWKINSIGNDIYYSNGTVWFSIDWDYIVDENETKSGYSQLSCIKLDNNKLLPLSDKNDEQIKYEYKWFTDDYVILCKRYTEQAPLSDYEFYKKYEQGEFSDLPGDDSWELHYRYLLEFNELYPEKYDYYSYNIKNDEIILLDSGDSIPIDDKEYNVISGYVDPYIFLGEYNGQLINSLYDYDMYGNVDEQFSLWNIENNKRTDIAKINMHGEYGVCNMGNLTLNIFNNSKMFYSVYKENDMMDFYCYDFNTSESTFLFEDKQYLSWRPQYETDEFFLCQKGDPNIFGEEVEDLYKISKDDYLNGNFKNAKKIKL